MHQSIPSANIFPGYPRGFAPIFSPGPGDLYHLNCPGVAQGSDLLSKYQVVSLCRMKALFSYRIYLPSIAALWLQNLFQSLGGGGGGGGGGRNFKTFKYGA